MKETYEALTLSNTDVTYTVGQKGDFDTLNHCFDYIENLIVQPKSIRVILLKDYHEEQLFLRDKRYNHITITSENDIVEAYETELNRQVEIKNKPYF
ncbi:hypothetical protein CoNPh35_CDS0015 [Staphylococcus phage S-CoN_Ph35]|nr:hypothetical protein CoNPh35_CDS0015 [Staphylococcus phage S-CoN_Ph35]